MRAFLIDFENVKSAGLVGIETLGIDDQVVILYSVNSNTISFEMHQKIMSCAANVEYYQIRRGGKNSLDFQLSSLLGYLLASGLYSHLYIISNDSGFDALYDFWTSQYIPTDVVVYRRPNIAMSVAHSAFLAARQNFTEPEAGETEEVDVTVDDSSAYDQFSIDEPIAVEAEEVLPEEEAPSEAAEEQDDAETAAILGALQAAQLEETAAVEEKPAFQESHAHDDELSAAGRMKQAELDEEEDAALPALFISEEAPASEAAEPETAAESESAEEETEARPRRRRGRPRRSGKAEKETAAAAQNPQPREKAEPAAVAALSAKLEAELADICSGEQLNSIAEEILLSEGKQEFYRSIIRRFGQKKGLVVYKAIKSEFSALKKL